jgi:hypothetical protein
MIFDFDFRNTRLSSTSRQQLNNITTAIKPGSKAAETRSGLLRLIETRAFDPTRGFYVPLSDHLFLNGKLPTYSEQLCPTHFPSSPFQHCYFTNALLIPLGYGDGSFDEKSALEPKHRATNIGFLVITIEYDCRTTEEMEECLAWTRGGDGEFTRSAFAAVDRELARFAEYRGYTIVFTGNRSLHFHLIFSTKHLESVPWDLTAEDRLAQSHAELLNQAHQSYWDTTAEIFASNLRPSLSPDESTRVLSQWRRSPWAWRRLDKDSEVLGLPTGTVIPQLVIHEKIRSRASRNSEDLLVPSDFRPTPIYRPKHHSKRAPGIQIEDQELLLRIRECCRDEWGGEYPKPAAVRSDGREWTINFWNNADDKNPSTVVKGSYRRLKLNGAHSFTQEFYLPDHMSADELCENLAEQANQQSQKGRQTEKDGQPEDTFQQTEGARCPSSEIIPPFLTGDQPKRNWIESQIDRIHSSFAQPIAETDPAKIKSIYRQRLWSGIREARISQAPVVLNSAEGIGKTTSLFEELALEILDLAMSIYPKQRFACIACRSIEQAEEKAKEYEESGKYRNAVVLMSVQKHYERKCKAQGVEPIPSHYFPDHSLNGFLGHIKSKQPEVFEALEKTRRELWRGEDGTNLFNSGNTILFTTHALVRCWDWNHTTRT